MASDFKLENEYRINIRYSEPSPNNPKGNLITVLVNDGAYEDAGFFMGQIMTRVAKWIAAQEAGK